MWSLLLILNIEQALSQQSALETGKYEMVTAWYYKSDQF